MKLILAYKQTSFATTSEALKLRLKHSDVNTGSYVAGSLLYFRSTLLTFEPSLSVILIIRLYETLYPRVQFLNGLGSFSKYVHFFASAIFILFIELLSKEIHDAQADFGGAVVERFFDVGDQVGFETFFESVTELVGRSEKRNGAQR